MYPVGLNHKVLPPFKRGEGLYVCLERNTDQPGVGVLPAEMCDSTINVTGWENMTMIRQGRADIYWLCGDSLYLRLTEGWSGRCALVALVTPITLIGRRTTGSGAAGHRRRRWVKEDFDLTNDPSTYIDSIGIPRGVPDKYKLADQVAAGFESVLIWVTPNKNVDRINYVHYNVQKLANLTRDAIDGLHEQLAATSLMAFQSRLALDMLLAEKGGVCSMFGESCCTFIPNNTAPDGSVSRALKGLRALSNSMAEDSGVKNPVTEWMGRMFGQWKGLVMSLMMSLAVFTAILVTCGCCCIPCLRALLQRLITRDRKSVV